MTFKERLLALSAGISEIPLKEIEKIFLKKLFINRDIDLIENYLLEILINRTINKNIVHPIECLNSECLNDSRLNISEIYYRGFKIIEDYNTYIKFNSKYGTNSYITCPGLNNYPESLLQIKISPLILFIETSLSESENLFFKKKPLVAIVGSRKLDHRGFDTAFNLSLILARAGVLTVSGMAYGIDSAAHRGTLEMPGSTVAVLGTAINSTYPSSNYQLRNKIIKFKGAVISEYPVNAKPEIYYFPARNRIVSGLSHALVVVSAAEKSGALITADFAHSEGKPVYVFTGPETRQLCKGCNRLVANKKAVGVESVEQLVKELETFFYSQNIGFGVDNCETIRINMNNSSVENKKMNKNLALNKNSAIKDVCCKVLENLEPGINVETLASKAGCTLSQAGAAITELELNGYIKRGANGNIIPLTQEGNRNGKNSDNC